MHQFRDWAHDGLRVLVARVSTTRCFVNADTTVSTKPDKDRAEDFSWHAASPLRRDEAGHVGFDDRGNAVFQWHDADLNLDSDAAARNRQRALNNPTFSLVDDEPRPDAPIRQNPKGLRVGYNPYESGMLSGRQPKKKRDLRALSAWIEQRRKLGNDPQD